MVYRSGQMGNERMGREDQLMATGLGPTHRLHQPAGQIDITGDGHCMAVPLEVTEGAELP